MTTDRHALDNSGAPDEPDGGWVAGPELSDSEILTIALCRFTGLAVAREDGVCPERVLNHHPDTPCVTLYHQAEALRDGRVHYQLPATEVTRPLAGGEPTYQNPLA